MCLKLVAETHLYYPGNMTNKLSWHTMSDKMWYIDITVKFSKQRDTATTEFVIAPPISTPKKYHKELTFKTSSYKELHKWLKKNKETIGKFSLGEI